MNLGPKIRKIIWTTLGLEECVHIHQLAAKLRAKGYNTLMVRYEQVIGDSYPYPDPPRTDFSESAEDSSQSLLVLLGQVGIEKDGFLIFEKYWVEIPKDKALTILAFNYLPDAQSRGFQTQNNP
jgi:hypothetical protein